MFLVSTAQGMQITASGNKILLLGPENPYFSHFGSEFF